MILEAKIALDTLRNMAVGNYAGGCYGIVCVINTGFTGEWDSYCQVSSIILLVMHHLCGYQSNVVSNINGHGYI